jgi:hypothetical protein
MAHGRQKKHSDGATPAKAAKARGSGNGANLGFEAQLFLAADKLRKNLEPSDYKHVCLGLTPPQSPAPKILEPRRYQLGVAHRVLNILVAEIGL